MTSTTSVKPNPTGIGSDYGSSGYVRIIRKSGFTRSGDTLTLTTRTKSNNSKYASTGRQPVQLYLSGIGQTAQNIVYNLLVN